MSRPINSYRISVAFARWRLLEVDRENRQLKVIVYINACLVFIRVSLNHGFAITTPVHGHCSGSYRMWKELFRIHTPGKCFEDDTTATGRDMLLLWRVSMHIQSLPWCEFSRRITRRHKVRRTATRSLDHWRSHSRDEWCPRKPVHQRVTSQKCHRSVPDTKHI